MEQLTPAAGDDASSLMWLAGVRAERRSRPCDGWNTRVHILSGGCDPLSGGPSLSFLRK